MSGLKLSPYEIEVITKNGKILPYEVNACKINYMGKPADMVIFRDIQDRKKAQEDLRIAHEKLKMMNEKLEEKVKKRTIKIQNLLKQKNEFITQLGHDLKNPLNPIVNLLPVVEKHEMNSKSKDMLRVIIRNVDYIKNLVVKTLELARLNASDVGFCYEDVNLSEKVNVVVENNKHMFKENNIVVENNINKNIYVNVDKLRVEELFDNIINNAVKYSPDGGNIIIDAKDNKNLVIVSVKDSGIGMTNEQLEHIFDEFYKADSSRHDFDDTGLGLSICRRIVEKHGGHIWANSPGKGQGSTLFFTIPKS
jgi:signal transduction histidine kinase